MPITPNYTQVMAVLATLKALKVGKCKTAKNSQKIMVSVGANLTKTQSRASMAITAQATATRTIFKHSSCKIACK